MSVVIGNIGHPAIGKIKNSFYRCPPSNQAPSGRKSAGQGLETS